MATRSRSEIRQHFSDQGYPVDRMFGEDIGGLLRLKSTAPIKPRAPQARCDIGLFSDEADQLDLVEMFQD